MINEIYILHKCHSGNFPSHPGKKSAGLFCVGSYHQEIIVKLGEYGFNAFAEAPISPRRRSPVYLIQSIRDFKCDVSCLEKILLNLHTDMSFCHPASYSHDISISHH